MRLMPADLDARTMIPDLLEAAPQVRPVLDRYGLRGCGGTRGPVESLEFFAKAHDVPINRLLPELQEAAERPSDSAGEPTAGLADTIYRPFFIAGIAVALTLGASWGAYLLLQIAQSGSFRAVGLHEVNAHGHAQIFGWVGLFVMGFAYQAFPRFKHTSLSFPGLALLSFWLMLVGIVTRSLAEPFVAAIPWLAPVAIGAGMLEVAAISLFVGIIAATLRGAHKPLAHYDYYVIAALVWFIVQAVYDVVYLAATLLAPDATSLRQLVATWQGPLREIQIHGFAMLMILGVSQRVFHHFYGLPAPSERLSRWALVALNAAVGGEVIGLLLMRTAGYAWAGLWYASVALMVVSVSLLVWNWRLFDRPTETDRSLKFLRAAYVWLFVSLNMLLWLPVYQYWVLPYVAADSNAVQIGFSHAYYGAIRHAITVGFVSLMIVGMAAKVVPTLNGVDVRRLSGLWLPFVLLNTGCGLRVVGQTLTDMTSHAFPFAGVSGCLEVAGLALWGFHVLGIMAGWVKPRDAAADGDSSYEPVIAGQPLTARNRVTDVIDQRPELLETFVAFGFRPLANPILRKTLARRLTIADACRKLDVEPGNFLNALNAHRAPEPARRPSLPVLVEQCQSHRNGASGALADPGVLDWQV